MSMQQAGRPTSADAGSAALERERERRLFLRLRRFEDGAARGRLIERYLPLARHLAHRYSRPGAPIEDLVQVASVGLVKAVDGFDPSRGTAFSTYAVPTITGELKRHLRDAGWGIHLPRGTQERVLKLGALRARLSRDLGRSPTRREIIDAGVLTAEQVTEAMEAEVAARLAPIEAVGESPGGRVDAGPAGGAEDEAFALVDDRDAVARAMGCVPARDRLVLRLRFWDELTQSEIADRLGISQMQVSRVIRRTLEHLQEAADPPRPGAALAGGGRRPTARSAAVSAR